MARPASTRWYAAIAALVVFLLLAWLLGEVLPLTPPERTVLRVGLVVLGLIAAVSLLWFLRPDAPGPRAATGGDDALVAIRTARARLPRGVGSFDRRPLVLLVGTQGSCKSTVMVRSGLDAELLAGDVTNDAPASTAAINLWLARDAVFTEPGGRLLADGARWRQFVRALRPPALAAALGREEPAPRAAVVCVSCDLFFNDQGQQLEATATLLRERLTEASRAFGLALPVYVLFTKADRLPHFEAWSAPLTRDEIREPLGAALAFDQDATAASAVGSYAERLAPRLEAAFRALAGSLAARRPALLGRESQDERRLAAYELPRELEQARPPPRRASSSSCAAPCSSARARSCAASTSSARGPSSSADGVAGRTAGGIDRRAGRQRRDQRVRAAHGRRRRAGAVGGYAPPTGRKVPQWVFLDRLFPDVVLADGGAASAARGGARVAGRGAPCWASASRRRSRWRPASAPRGSRTAACSAAPRPRRAPSPRCRS